MRAPSSAHGAFDRFALKLMDNGYVPLPLDGKKPAIRNWNKLEAYTDRSIKALLRQFGDHNVGVRTGEVLAVDIDLTDPDKAHDMAFLAMETLGITEFIRIGRWPKRALLYRAEIPKRKQVVGKVELLGQGQQIAVAGIHPDTGQPYSWPIESIFDCPLGQLPVAMRSAIEVFLVQAARLQGLAAPNTKGVSPHYEGRNSELFAWLKEFAAHASCFEKVAQESERINQTFSPPLEPSEVDQIARSVWRYKQQGRLMLKGQQSIVLPFGADKVRKFASIPRALYLYASLRGFDARGAFTIPQLQTAKELSWGKDTVRQAIRQLITADLIEITQAGEKTEGAYQPIWYRFTSRR